MISVSVFIILLFGSSIIWFVFAFVPPITGRNLFAIDVALTATKLFAIITHVKGWSKLHYIIFFANLALASDRRE